MRIIRVETLAEKIKKILDENGLNQAMFAKRYGVNKSTVSRAINGHDVSNSFIEQLANVFGDEFKRYYTTTICEICGKEFISFTNNCRMCSAECQKQKIKENSQRWVDRRSYIRSMIINAEFKNIENKVIKKAEVNKVPEKTIAEFMAGKSYGDRQREYLLNLQKTQRMEIR